MSDSILINIYLIFTLITLVWFPLKARKRKKSVVLWIVIPLVFPVVSWIFGYYYLFNKKRAAAESLRATKEKEEAVLACINGSKAQFKAHLLMMYADGEVSEVKPFDYKNITPALDMYITSDKEVIKLLRRYVKFEWCQGQMELSDDQKNTLTEDAIQEVTELIDDLKNCRGGPYNDELMRKFKSVFKEMGAALLAMQESDKGYNPKSEERRYCSFGWAGEVVYNEQHSEPCTESTMRTVLNLIQSAGERHLEKTFTDNQRMLLLLLLEDGFGLPLADLVTRITYYEQPANKWDSDNIYCTGRERGPDSEWVKVEKITS